MTAEDGRRPEGSETADEALRLLAGSLQDAEMLVQESLGSLLTVRGALLRRDLDDDTREALTAVKSAAESSTRRARRLIDDLAAALISAGLDEEDVSRLRGEATALDGLRNAAGDN